MKKLISLFSTVILLSSSILAQDNDQILINRTDFRNRLMIGVKLGTNYSNVYDSKGEDFLSNPKFGFAGGVFLAIPIGKLLGVQPELLYSQRGFKATGNILGESYDLTRTSNYFDVPVLFAFKPSEFISLLAGPQYSYLITQKDVFANTSTTIDQMEEFQNEEFRKNTLSLLVGLDLTLKHLVFSARAGWDLQSNNSDGSSTTPQYKNMWYQATIGYRFYQH